MDDQTPLVGKVAIITGASRGIGFAVAKRLAQLGADLVICARNPEVLATAARDLEREGTKVLAVPADMAKPADIESLMKHAEKASGPVEILVNNAGVGYFGPFQDATEENWDAVIDTNLKAVFLLSKAIAPAMIRRKSGHIVNIASLAGKNAFAGGAIYCASKWGLLGLTACMAEDLRAYGIRVSAVCPGPSPRILAPTSGKIRARCCNHRTSPTPSR